MSIVLVQTAIADYRNAFVSHLVEELDGSVEIFVGEKYFEDSTVTSDYVLSLPNTTKITNLFFLRRRLCFQKLPLIKLISSEVVIFELNPRLLSNWLILLIRKVIGKKNVIWGHAWARRGVDSRTEPVRHLMRKLGDSLIFYTNNQMREFTDRYPSYNRILSVAPNSLYSEGEIYSIDGSRSNIIYVGRLVESKRVDLLIHGFSLAVKAITPGCRLRIVGSGPDSERLKKLTKDLDLSDQIEFLGHVSDVNRLRQLYSNSLFSVSPGYVGLSITQSFAFGVPMLVADDEPHSPEIEAFIDGENGYLFRAGDEKSLAEKIIKFYSESSKWSNSSQDIVEDCRNRYSVEKMVEGFVYACQI